MWSAGIVLCTSQMFTFLVLPMGVDVSNCIEPIKHTTLKLGVYFAFHVDFLSKILIMTKSAVL